MRLFMLAILALFVAASPAAAQAKKKPAPAAAKKAPVRAAWTATIVKTPEGGYRMGNPNAPLKLVEYGSRSCPTCARFAAESKPLVTTYIASGKVSWEYRDFLIHPQDVAISALGRCVAPAAYFRTLDAMFAGQGAFNQRATALSEARLGEIQAMPLPQQSRAYADELGYTALMKQRGMTEANIQQCLGTRDTYVGLADLADRAEADGVNGTPTFFLNGRRLDNVFGWSQLEPLLK